MLDQKTAILDRLVKLVDLVQHIEFLFLEKPLQRVVFVEQFLLILAQEFILEDALDFLVDIPPR